MGNSDPRCSASGCSPKSPEHGNLTPDLERLATAAHEAALAERNNGAPNDCEDASPEAERMPEGAKRVGCAAPVCLHPGLPLLGGVSDNHPNLDPNAVHQVCAVCDGSFHASCGNDCESESAKASLKKYGFADAHSWCGCNLGAPLKGASLEDNENKTRKTATQAQLSSMAADGGNETGEFGTINEQAGAGPTGRCRPRTDEEKEKADAIKREKDRARQKRHRDKKRQEMAGTKKVPKLQAHAPTKKPDGRRREAKVHIAKSINLEPSNINPLMASFDGGGASLRHTFPGIAVPSVRRTFQAQRIAIPPAATHGAHGLGSIKNAANPPASTAGHHEQESMTHTTMERALTVLLENFTAKGQARQQADERITLLEENKKKIEICNMSITSWTIILNTQGVDPDCRAMASKELSQAMKDLKQCYEASMLLGSLAPSASHQPGSRSSVQHQ